MSDLPAWLDAVSRLLDAVAWPVVGLTTVVLLREPLRKALEGKVDVELPGVKFSSTPLDLAEQAAKLRGESVGRSADSLLEEDGDAYSTGEEVQEPVELLAVVRRLLQRSQDDKNRDAELNVESQRLLAMARKQPLLAIQEAWSFLATTAGGTGKPSGSHRADPETALAELINCGFLPSEGQGLLRELRRALGEYERSKDVDSETAAVFAQACLDLARSVLDAQGKIVTEAELKPEAKLEPETEAILHALPPDPDWTITPGSRLRRREVHDRYGGNPMSGISASRSSPNILLFSSVAGAAHGYDNAFNDDGTYTYYGEGQVGNQTVSRGNLAVLTHLETGRHLRLFFGQGDATVIYDGEYLYDSHDVITAIDREGRARELLRFRLRPRQA